jgi:hypothetical protein
MPLESNGAYRCNFHSRFGLKNSVPTRPGFAFDGSRCERPSDALAAVASGAERKKPADCKIEVTFKFRK